MSSVQGGEQNQEYEEKSRRRKLDEVTPLILNPLQVQDVFSAIGAGEGGSDVL